ncbi:MAG: phosphate acyltransferase PlsX [Candidatus Sumerlaeia bacterium]
MRIALDAMAGDFGPEPLVKGAIEAVEQSDHHVVLVGDSEVLENILNRENALHPRLSIVHADTVVSMEEAPKASLRKKTSSISVAVDLVKRGEADGVVSAGNTGATLATTVQKWRTLEGVSRPTLATVIPLPSHPVVLLDVGANIDCKPVHLSDFAVMGSIYAREIFGRRSPRVGLLNIGAEEGKGNELAQATYNLLSEGSLNFIGNVEGGDIFNGKADVVVCDGFVGNVVLKFAEGFFHFIGHYIKTEARKNKLRQLGGLMLHPVFKGMKRQLDSSQLGGAPLLGLNGICIVGHGASGKDAIKNAIIRAADCVRQDINGKIVRAMHDGK